MYAQFAAEAASTTQENFWGIDWTAVGGMAAALTGLVAIITLWAARTDSRERSRPVMVAEYRMPVEMASKRVDLVVRNAGASVAREIDVTFSPELEERTGDDLTRTSIIERYANRIPVLAPGQELSNVVEFDHNDEAKSDLPHLLTVRFSYRRNRFMRYTDTYELSEHVMAQETWASSSDSVRGHLKEIKMSLKEGTATLKAIARKMPSGD